MVHLDLEGSVRMVLLILTIVIYLLNLKNYDECVNSRILVVRRNFIVFIVNAA